MLPSKLMSLNKKILDFDDLLINELPRLCSNVSVVRGGGEFLDTRSGLLSENLSKSRQDPLHINSAGRGLLVRLIKDAIFNRKKGKIDSRPFNVVAKAGGGGAGTT